MSRSYHRRIADSFSGKAHLYETHADIQRTVIQKLLSGINNTVSTEGMWLNIGAGTGLFEKLLPHALYPSCMVSVDISAGSLFQAKKTTPLAIQPVIADMHRLPFHKSRFSAVVMTSALQWSTSAFKTIQQVKEALRPGGHFLFSVFLRGYMSELEQIYNEMGTGLEVFLPTQQEFNALLSDCDFATIWSGKLAGKQYFTSTFALVKSLAAIGATARRSGGVHKSVFDFCRAYTQRFGTDRGVPLSYEAMVGIARSSG